MNMHESEPTFSNEPVIEPKLVSVKLIELEALSNTLNNVTVANVVPKLSAAKAAIARIIAEAKPKASYANENDKPRDDGAPLFFKPGNALKSLYAPACDDQFRTVKGETLGEQAARIRNGLQAIPKREHSHYFKDVSNLDEVDVYRILELFAITDQALGHAIKKLLVAGGRGAGKDIGQDIKEAIDTLKRWQEMHTEDAVASRSQIARSEGRA